MSVVALKLYLTWALSCCVQVKPQESLVFLGLKKGKESWYPPPFLLRGGAARTVWGKVSALEVQSRRREELRSASPCVCWCPPAPPALCARCPAWRGAAAARGLTLSHPSSKPPECQNGQKVGNKVREKQKNLTDRKTAAFSHVSLVLDYSTLWWDLVAVVPLPLWDVVHTVYYTALTWTAQAESHLSNKRGKYLMLHLTSQKLEGFLQISC